MFLKRPNKSKLIEENKQYKQKAYNFTTHTKYRGAINCYKKIAHNIKIEKKIEKNATSKSLLKYRLKKIATLIKNLKAVENASNEIFSNLKSFYFKDLQNAYHLELLEQVNPEQDEKIQIRKVEDSPIPKKKCYKCKCDITFQELKNANPFKDVEYLKKLLESPYIEFYCCNCFEIETKLPYLLIRNLIQCLNFLEKDIEYPIKKLCNLELSHIQEEDMKVYFKEIIKIKKNLSNNLTKDISLISLIKEFIPDFIITDDEKSIIIQKTVLYHKFTDYEKTIVFIARSSRKRGAVDGCIQIPKRLKTSNFLKAKGFLYKKKRGTNRYYLTSIGRSEYFQITYHISSFHEI